MYLTFVLAVETGLDLYLALPLLQKEATLFSLMVVLFSTLACPFTCFVFWSVKNFDEAPTIPLLFAICLTDIANSWYLVSIAEDLETADFVVALISLFPPAADFCEVIPEAVVYQGVTGSIVSILHAATLLLDVLFNANSIVVFGESDGGSANATRSSSMISGHRSVDFSLFVSLVFCLTTSIR